MRKISRASLIVLALCSSSHALAGFSFAPYASIKSTKSLSSSKTTSGTDTESIKQRKEYGLRASLSFFRILKAQLSAGQSKLTTTQKTTAVTDEYGDIDLQSDLSIDTSDPTKDVTITETQNIGKFSLLIDPSFSVFITRLKLGITARQRILEKTEIGSASVKITDGPKYLPHSGVGVGIRFSPKMYFMAEYEFTHYKYPPLVEPFERELSVSYNVSL